MAKKWLDIYFSGKEPNFKLPLKFTGSEFQNEVWEILYAIPYGKTVTYGEIAKELANRRGIGKMSAQAVGGAVGKRDFNYCALSQSSRFKRKPDGICRRN